MNTATSLERVDSGDPGIAARWTSSAKSGVGTALNNQSRVWFTLSHDICNEIYYPCINRSCVRDMELVVTDGATLFSEAKRDTNSVVHWLVDGVIRIGRRCLRRTLGMKAAATPGIGTTTMATANMKRALRLTEPELVAAGRRQDLASRTQRRRTLLQTMPAWGFTWLACRPKLLRKDRR